MNTKCVPALTKDNSLLSCSWKAVPRLREIEDLESRNQNLEAKTFKGVILHHTSQYSTFYVFEAFSPTVVTPDCQTVMPRIDKDMSGGTELVIHDKNGWDSCIQEL